MPRGGSAGGAPDSQTSPFVCRRRLLQNMRSLLGHRNPTTDDPPVAGQVAGRFRPVNEGASGPPGDVSGSPCSGVPRPRVGRAASPRGPRGPAAGHRPGVRRPAAPPPAARDARLMLDNARAVVADCLGVRPDEVTFTPSGTHACHLGVLGLLAGRARHGNLLLASSVEHSAVLHAGAWHAERGGRFETFAVDAPGRVDLDALAAAVDARASPAVVAVQSANPEVGVCQPVDEVAALHRRAAVRRRLRFRRAAARSPRAGPLRPRPRTSGAVPPASACCWSARALAGATRSPATTASTSDPPASRTCPPLWPPPPRCAPASTTRSGSPSSTGHLTAHLADAARAIPDTEVFLARRPTAPRPGGVLLPLRRRRGARDRARPSRLRGRERVGLHGQHARAEPRARRDGRAHPRQRARLARPGHRRRSGPSARRASCPGSSRGCAREAGVPD